MMTASFHGGCATCCCSASSSSTLQRRASCELVAAAGRDVSYVLLRGLAARPEHDVQDSLREAVEQRVLVADQGTGSFRFRLALLAEAIYATILPGEREGYGGEAGRGACA